VNNIKPISWWHGRPARAHAQRLLARTSRAFTILEMQIALVISALIFTAMLTALDTMFKGYETNAEAASSNVVTRLVVNRVLSMVRTGSDFRPHPDDVLDNDANPLFSDYMEFVSLRDDDDEPIETIRIEFRYAGEGAQLRSWGVGQEEPALGFQPAGNGSLWLIRTDLVTGDETESILLDNVRQVLFTLRYDIGPRLTRATIDITADPDTPQTIALSTDAPPPALRMVASAMPRRAGN
jgi:type II secretory pathway pseudopilin PulG